MGFIQNVHEIRQRPEETYLRTVMRHLVDVHSLSPTVKADTAEEIDRLHARFHRDRMASAIVPTIGNEHPETDSPTTQQQKQELRQRFVTELGVRLPEWLFTHSYLSDLRTIERIIRAAHLARPEVPLPGSQADVDNPNQA